MVRKLNLKKLFPIGSVYTKLILKNLTEDARYEYDRQIAELSASVRRDQGLIKVATEEGIQIGIEKGREEGRAEGREKGREETNKKIANNLREKGHNESFIAQILGISMEEVQYYLRS